MEDAERILARLAVMETRFNDYVAYQEHQKAIQRGELDRRLEEMNKFREQINQERGDFATREQMDEKFNFINGRISSLELTSSNLQGKLYVVGAIISVVVSLVVIATNLVVKLK